MIVEMRTYRLRIGGVGAYMRIYQEQGLAVQTRILGHMIGWYSSEIGELNQIVHLWAYRDLNDRAQRRARLFEDPEWLAFVEASKPYVEQQASTILNPAPWMKMPGPVA